MVDTVLSRHAYPEPVSHALGEALALTAMLGSALKVEAKLILQTKTDGALDLLVADFVAPGKVRGYASFDKSDAGLAEAKGRGDQGVLLGKGHMAMTIDPGSDKDRYQGIVPLEGEPLVDAAHTYFRQSEQLPTFIRLAVARHYGPAAGEGQRVWAWRAGGLMIQQLPREGGKRRDAAASEDDDEENWTRARHLAATVEDHELLDPMLSPERLLYRLFHEEGVRVTPDDRACRRMPLLARAHPGLSAAFRRRGAERHARARWRHHRHLRVLLAQVPLLAGRYRLTDKRGAGAVHGSRAFGPRRAAPSACTG